MRITNGMMVSNLMRNLNNSMLRLEKLNMQGATTKRIHRPSDDPVAVSRVLKIRSDIQELEQYEKNVDDAISWMEATESSVNSMTEAMNKLRELTVQAANGVGTKEETQKIQQEIAQIKEHIIQLGNSTYGGKYIFSGKKTNAALLDADGNYNIDLFDAKNPNLVDHRMKYEVGTGELIAANTLGIDFFESHASNEFTLEFPTRTGPQHATKMQLDGVEVTVEMTDAGYMVSGEVVVDKEGNTESFAFGPSDSKEETATNIMNELNTIIQDIEDPYHPSKNLTFTTQELKQGRVTTEQGVAEENWVVRAQPQKAGLIHLIERIEGHMIEGNHEELNNLLGDIDKYMDALSVSRSEIGAKINRMDLIKERIADDILNLEALMTKLEGADMGKVAMELMKEENAYQAALSIGARIIQPSLLDFLR